MCRINLGRGSHAKRFSALSGRFPFSAAKSRYRVKREGAHEWFQSALHFYGGTTTIVSVIAKSVNF